MFLIISTGQLVLQIEIIKII